MDLPGELLLHLCDHMTMRDVVSISLCNRYLYELAEEKRYSRIFLGNPTPIGQQYPDPERDSERLFHPLLFLRMILLSPDLAKFVRVVNLDYWWTPADYIYYFIGENVKADISQILLSKNIIKPENVEELYRMMDWNDDRNDGRWAYLTVYILMLLPNVRLIHDCLYQGTRDSKQNLDELYLKQRAWHQRQVVSLINSTRSASAAPVTSTLVCFSSQIYRLLRYWISGGDTFYQRRMGKQRQYAMLMYRKSNSSSNMWRITLSSKLSGASQI